MPVAGVTLERLVSDHLDTDDRQGDLASQATIVAGDPLFPNVVELLGRVQLLSNTSFLAPDQFSQEDINELVRAVRLLQGDTVTGTWREATLGITPTASGLEILEREINNAPMIIAQEQTLLLAGHALPLGSIATHLLSVRIERWDKSGDDSRGRLAITPGDTDEFESWQITGDAGIDSAIPGVSRKFKRQVGEFMDRNDGLLRRLAQ
jgi:hypothetical protein